MSDPRVVSGLEAAIGDWRTKLAEGADRVGWKIGLNVPEIQERLGMDEPAIGYITSETVVEDGGEYASGSAVDLRAEPEVAVEVGAAVPPDADADQARDAIAGLAVAIELVDIHRPPIADAEGIIAGNIFHRAVVFGPTRPAMPAEGMQAVIRVGGEERGTGDAPDDFTEVVRLTARLLGEVGERLEAGDRIIAGALTPPVQVTAGDAIEVDIEGLGAVRLRVAP